MKDTINNSKLIERIIFTNGLSSYQKILIMKIAFRFKSQAITRVEVQIFLKTHMRNAQRVMQYMREAGITEKCGSRGNLPMYKLTL